MAKETSIVGKKNEVKLVILHCGLGLLASANRFQQLVSIWLVLTCAMLCWVPGSAELSSSPDMVLAVSWASGQQAAARGVKIKPSVAFN